MMRLKRATTALALAISGLSGSAVAHHSAAMFDMTKTVTITGTVKRFEWANPHAWVTLLAPYQAGGPPEEWRVECSSLNIIARKGWSARVIKPGDRTTIELHPMKDGTPGGYLLTASLMDGKVLKDHDY